MKRRSLILMILIVLLPVTLLTWLGVRIMRDEQSVTQQRFRSVMEQRLMDVNRVISSRFAETERRLQQITSVNSLDAADLREIVRTEPQVTQLFVLSPDGDLLYPNPGDSLNGTEVSFLKQASRMFTDRDLQNAVALAESRQGDFAPTATNDAPNSLPRLMTEPDVNVQQQMSRAESLPIAPEATPQLRSAAEPQIAAAPNQSEAESGLENAAATQADAANAPGEEMPPREGAVTQSSQSLSGQTSAVDLTQMTDRPVASPEALSMGGSLLDGPLAGGLPAANAAAGDYAPSHGWFVWYWDRGLNLIYWQRRPSGHIVGAALERARWIADLIAWLPETDAAGSGTPSTLVETSFRVVSSAAEVVYEWGASEPSKDAIPFCEVPLTPPLASWRLQCFVPADQVAAGSGRSAFLGFSAGLGGFALTLTSLAWLLYRDYSRDMREASQQVSFVNQVSHELKTPLTNIRLYAELLERDLEQVTAEQSETPLRRLGIITSEAQRLSRLIGNVLTFARQRRKTLQLHPIELDVLELVRQIADRFAPSLNDHGIEVHVEGRCSHRLRLDPDFVEQILGNLISNVEKYAATGKTLAIKVESQPDKAIIDVIDAGPGIAAVHRADVFRPFARLSDDLRASNGTGIGLSITRELARLHGGDVILKDSATGCWFQVQLQSQGASSQAGDS